MADLVSRIVGMSVDPTQSISSLLRQCLVLAYRLELDDFVQWATYELNGYQDKETVPEYRKVKSHCYGTVTNGFVRQSHFPIPTLGLPEKMRVFFETMYLMEPIGVVEKMAVDAPHDGILQAPVPPNLLASLRANLKLTAGGVLESAYQAIPAMFPQGVLELVRNKILMFSIEVRKMGVTVDIDSDEKASPKEKEQVHQVFNNIVYGNVGGMISGVQGDANISVQQGITEGDLESLLQKLSDLGLNKEHIVSLREAATADVNDPSRDKKSIGKRVASWFGNISTQVLAGATTGVAVDKLPVLLGMIQSYFGM